MIFQGILTRALSVTNTLGQRVKATCSSATLTCDWDYALDVETNHRMAAEEIVAGFKLDGSWKLEGGCLANSSYCWVVVKQKASS